MVLVGWGGAEGLAPVVGIFFFVGPVLLFVSMILEWVMGNFFTVSKQRTHRLCPQSQEVTDMFR